MLVCFQITNESSSDQISALHNCDIGCVVSNTLETNITFTWQTLLSTAMYKWDTIQDAVDQGEVMKKKRHIINCLSRPMSFKSTSVSLLPDTIRGLKVCPVCYVPSAVVSLMIAQISASRLWPKTLHLYHSFQQTYYVNEVSFHKAQSSIYPLQIEQHGSDFCFKAQFDGGYGVN